MEQSYTEARATDAAPGIKSIWDSTGQAGGRPGKSSGNTSGKSRMIGTSFILYSLPDLVLLFLGGILRQNTWHPFAMENSLKLLNRDDYQSEIPSPLVGVMLIKELNAVDIKLLSAPVSNQKRCKEVNLRGNVRR
ncbi:hypothetical protein Tco_0407804 [Tanacetum coccineum]